MSEGTDKHLEHAEHAQHHAHNPFDRRVAMTMAIMAALLAGVTLVSHRGHTETLRLATEATTNHTKASDDWNLYQAKNIRSHEYQAFLFLQAMLAKDAVKQDEETETLRNYWISQVEKFEGPGYWEGFVASVKKTKEKSQPKLHNEHPESTGHKPKDSKEAGSATAGGEREVLKKKAEERQAEAKELEAKSHELHENVTWIDIGHLGLELALVFCAVAVLTKQRSFWVIGVSFALAGSGIAAYGMVGWWLI